LQVCNSISMLIALISSSISLSARVGWLLLVCFEFLAGAQYYGCTVFILCGKAIRSVTLANCQAPNHSARAAVRDSSGGRRRFQHHTQREKANLRLSLGNLKAHAQSKRQPTASATSDHDHAGTHLAK
jgi:hypothetical protein